MLSVELIQPTIVVFTLTMLLLSNSSNPIVSLVTFPKLNTVQPAAFIDAFKLVKLSSNCCGATVLLVTFSKLKLVNKVVISTPSI